MTAPIFRAVNQHTGEVAERPSKWWEALSDADQVAAELAEVYELRTRVQELEAERDELVAQLAAVKAELRWALVANAVLWATS